MKPNIIYDYIIPVLPLVAPFSNIYNRWKKLYGSVGANTRLEINRYISIGAIVYSGVSCFVGEFNPADWKTSFDSGIQAERERRRERMVSRFYNADKDNDGLLNQVEFMQLYEEYCDNYRSRKRPKEYMD